MNMLRMRTHKFQCIIIFWRHNFFVFVWKSRIYRFSYRHGRVVVQQGIMDMKDGHRAHSPLSRIIHFSWARFLSLTRSQSSSAAQSECSNAHTSYGLAEVIVRRFYRTPIRPMNLPSFNRPCWLRWELNNQYVGRTSERNARNVVSIMLDVLLLLPASSGRSNYYGYFLSHSPSLSPLLPCSWMPVDIIFG